MKTTKLKSGLVVPFKEETPKKLTGHEKFDCSKNDRVYIPFGQLYKQLDYNFSNSLNRQTYSSEYYAIMNQMNSLGKLLFGPNWKYDGETYT
jgi:hypothetical protein